MADAIEAIPGDVVVSDPSASSGGDTGGDGDWTAAMDEIMASEQAVDDAAGFTITPRAEAAKTPMEAKSDDAPAPAAEAKPETPAAAVATPAPAAAAEEAPELAPPPIADIAAETRRIRKEHAKLAVERAHVVDRVAAANATLAQAKQFEADATAWRSLPERVKADPLAFLEQLGISQDVLLDKVIESEKPPEMREVEKLRKEIADREAAMKTADQQRAAAAEQARLDKVISDWTERNTNFAKSDPEKYDLINSLDQGAAVHETCRAYFDLHKVVLDPATAADYVEKSLRAGVAKSKYLKSLSAASTPAATPATARNGAQPSNGTQAPKRTGSTTLTGVATGDSAHTAADYPGDDEDRFKAVMNEMRAEGLV